MKKLQYIFLASVLIFSSCKKDHNVLGADVQPASDQLGAMYSDTSVIFAYTSGYDSIPSFNDRYKFLGSNHDPVFGRTDVGIYTNINIPNAVTNVSFGDDANLVSSEIILAVSGLEIHGDAIAALSYSVFPVTNVLDKNQPYYTHNKSQHSKNSLLGSYNGTISVMNDKLVLRIPIDFNFAKSVLNNPQYLVDDATLQSTYKGFYITAEGTNLNPLNQQGYIAKFDLEDEVSGFYLYYQNGTPSPARENKKFQFTFGGVDASRYNTVTYHKGTISNASLYSQLVDKDTTKGKQNLFLKGLGGSKVKLYIPGLKNYSDSFPVSVNRAELIVNVDPSFSTNGINYDPPPKLTLVAIDESTGVESYAIDQLTDTDLARYDGNYNSDNNRYVFNIARHVQAILRGTRKNNGFYLVVADPSPLLTARRDNYTERVIVGGSGHPTLKLQFNLSYLPLRYDK